MNTRAKNFLWGLVTQYLFQITMMLLQVVTAPLLLKMDGSKSLGAYAAIMQFVGYLTLLDFGFSSTLSRYLSQSYNENDGKVRFSNYFTIGRWYLMIVYFIMAVLIVVTSFSLPSAIGLEGKLKENARNAMIVLAVWYSIRSYFTMYAISLYATQRMRIANLCSTVGIIFRFILTLTLLKLGYSIAGIVAANVLGDLITGILQMLLFRIKGKGISYSWKVADRSGFKELFSFGLDAFLINISTRIILSSTTFVAGIMLGAMAASHYYSMITPVTLIFTFVNMIMYNLLPGMNEMVVKREWDNLKQIYQRTLKIKLTILIAAFWGLILFHGFVVSLWVGADQYEGRYYTVILAFYLLVITISSLNENVLIVLGDIKWFSRLQIGATLIGLICTIMGSYFWGLKGLVLGNFLSLTPAAIYVFIRLLKQLQIPIQFSALFPPIKYIFSISAVSMVIYFLEQRVATDKKFLLLIATGACFVFLIIFTGIDNNVRKRLLKFGRK